jgi:hypothetical protein
MSERDAEQLRTPPRGRPVLRAVDVPSEPRPAEQSAPSDSTVADGSPAARFVEALAAAEAQAQAVTARVAHVQNELRRARVVLAEADRSRTTLPDTETLVRRGVLALLGGLLALAVWARTVDYSLRVISDTPTFLALVAGMAKEPFTEQSPFLDAGVATQHATPYVQALAFIWQALDGSSNSPVALGGFLALVGIAVFAFMLWCVFLYVRRLAGATAAWVSIPVLLGIFGPPHVIWASDLSLHAALYAGFFPQNLALGTALLTLLALERRSPVFLVVSCLLAGLTMLVHPFTGVLLCVLVAAQSCHLAVQGDRMAAAKRPIALGAGFALGLLWPAYSLDRAFAETGLRGVLFVALCIAVVC